MSIPRPSKGYTAALIYMFALSLVGSILIAPFLWLICLGLGVLFASNATVYIRPRHIFGMAVALLLGGVFPWLLVPRIISPDLHNSLTRMILGAVAAPTVFLIAWIFMNFSMSGKKTKPIGSR